MGGAEVRAGGARVCNREGKGRSPGWRPPDFPSPPSATTQPTNPHPHSTQPPPLPPAPTHPCPSALTHSLQERASIAVGLHQPHLLVHLAQLVHLWGACKLGRVCVCGGG